MILEWFLRGVAFGAGFIVSALIIGEIIIWTENRPRRRRKR